MLSNLTFVKAIAFNSSSIKLKHMTWMTADSITYLFPGIELRYVQTYRSLSIIYTAVSLYSVAPILIFHGRRKYENTERLTIYYLHVRSCRVKCVCCVLCVLCVLCAVPKAKRAEREPTAERMKSRLQFQFQFLFLFSNFLLSRVVNTYALAYPIKFLFSRSQKALACIRYIWTSNGE